MSHFKGKQFEKDIIMVAVGYYLRYDLSYRDVSEILRIVMESKNQKTREERYDLSLQHFDALLKVQKYADKTQKKRIADAQDHFMIMNEYYKHRKQEKQERKKQK